MHTKSFYGLLHIFFFSWNFFFKSWTIDVLNHLMNFYTSMAELPDPPCIGGSFICTLDNTTWRRRVMLSCRAMLSLLCRPVLSSGESKVLCCAPLYTTIQRLSPRVSKIVSKVQQHIPIFDTTSEFVILFYSEVVSLKEFNTSDLHKWLCEKKNLVSMFKIIIYRGVTLHNGSLNYRLNNFFKLMKLSSLFIQ